MAGDRKGASQDPCNADVHTTVGLARPRLSPPLRQVSFRGKTSVELSYLSSSLLTEFNLSLQIVYYFL